MKLDIDFRFILTAGMLMLLKTDTADTFASVSGEGKRKKKKKRITKKQEATYHCN